MNIDIRTYYLAVSINALISTLAWRYAKSLKIILGYWGLSQILVASGRPCLCSGHHSRLSIHNMANIFIISGHTSFCKR